MVLGVTQIWGLITTSNVEKNWISRRIGKN